jgi:hypothetical protein
LVSISAEIQSGSTLAKFAGSFKPEPEQRRFAGGLAYSVSFTTHLVDR